MIDCEAQIFSGVATSLRSEHEGIYVAGAAISVPKSFPAVTLVEDDNSTYTQTLDSGGEKHATVLYTANVYSNKTPGGKSECKSIMATIDSEMSKLGFYRVGCAPMEAPNADPSIYRMVARYRATISNNEIIYRR